MNSTTSQEANSNQPLTQGVESLFRVAVGAEIETLFGELAVFGSHPDIDLPVAPDGEVKPRAILVKSTELRRSRQALLPLDIRNPYFTRDLKARLPTLNEPVKVATTGAEIRQNRRGNHYVGLFFDPESKKELVKSREGIFRELRSWSNSGKGLRRLAYKPDMLVVKMRTCLPEKAIKHITNHVFKHSKLEFSLEPLYDPSSEATEQSS
jgi:hypothetical protein